MTHECPSCGEDASGRVEIDRGTSWRDAIGRPPHTFFGEYVDVHVGERNGGTIVVYCHTRQDLGSSI